MLSYEVPEPEDVILAEYQTLDALLEAIEDAQDETKEVVYVDVH